MGSYHYFFAFISTTTFDCNSITYIGKINFINILRYFFAPGINNIFFITRWCYDT